MGTGSKTVLMRIRSSHAACSAWSTSSCASSRRTSVIRSSTWRASCGLRGRSLDASWSSRALISASSSSSYASLSGRTSLQVTVALLPAVLVAYGRERTSIVRVKRFAPE